MALDTSSRGRALPPRVNPPTRRLNALETFLVARRNLLETIPEAAFHERVMTGGRLTPWTMIMDPPLLEHVLKTREAIYPKSDATRRVLKPAEGESMFTAHGSHWRWQRRAAAPAFSPRALSACAPAMTRAAEACSARLARRGGAPADLHPEMVSTTFDVICDVALSGRETVDRALVSRTIDRFMESVARVDPLDVLGAPEYVPRPTRLFARRRTEMDGMVDRIIRARRKRGPADPPDLLDLMMTATDPQTGRAMSPAEIRNNLNAFILAGHETTALALSWALWLLAFDPAAQTRARDEAQAALGDRAATEADLSALPFARRVIEEAMRLYPPAALLARTAKAADDLGGEPVAPGDMVLIPIYALHRHRALWDDPDAFDPDRFAPEAAVGRHRYAYLPFGAGPRVCIGLAFAMMEAVIVLSTLLARFRFERVVGRDPHPRMTLTLRPEGGVVLRATRV
ncbi:MAG: cytochrome P450 [Rhodobacteraceae bacterium]|nr:MAG: cytochrome P450 [Paracoccaceae bacterium]